MTTSERIMVLVLMALVALALSDGAQAQLLGQRNSPLAKACGDELREHCRSVAPGQGRLVACLQQHSSQLGASCQAQLPQLAQCSAELQRVCGNTRAAGLRSCLKDKHEQISPACQQLAHR